jgi:hypothetical protein
LPNTQLPAANEAKNSKGAVTNGTANKPQGTGSGIISLHMEQIPAHEAFRLIVEQTGVQIFVFPEAGKRIVNVSLSDVTVDMAIKEVAQAAGLLSIKSEGKNGGYTIVVPMSPGQVPLVIVPLPLTPQATAAKSSEYSLRMLEPSAAIDPKMIIRGSANYSSKFVVPPPRLNPSAAPQLRLAPGSGTFSLRGKVLVPQAPHTLQAPQSQGLLKLPPLTPGPFAAPKPQFNVPPHR